MQLLFEKLEFDKLCEHLADYAVSDLGRDRALNLSPFENNDYLIDIHTQLTELRDINDYDSPVPLDGITDIRPILKKVKIIGSYLIPEEFEGIHKMLAAAYRIERFFKERSEKAPRILTIIKNLVPMRSTEKEINRCIDFVLDDVKDSASESLASIRQQIKRVQANARRKIESMLKSLSEKGMVQENVISVRNGRLVLMVKEQYKRQVKGLIHDQSASGSSFFIEPLSVLDDNNRLAELHAAEAHEVEKVLMALTESLRDQLPSLEQNVEILGEIDFLNAKAGFSRTIKANQPEIIDEPIIALAQAKHPLLSLRLGEKNVVPADITLGEKCHTVIISGPNAGGKTVTMKTIGLLTLMARCGLHIPALPHSRVGTIHSIFASIGDQQSIENDLSTFSSHVQELKDITEKTDQHSLVLIDEIGSGTDPEEGSALAMAILEHLTKVKALTIVTTHQSALKAFAYQTESVENASLEFNVDTLEPTYRFRLGIPGSSYAFEISKRLGLGEHITNQAKQLIGSQKNKLEGLILELEEKTQHYHKMNQDARVQDKRLKELTKSFEEKYKELKKNEKRLKREAAREAERIVRDANALVEKTIREIREQNAEKSVIQDAKKSIRNQLNELHHIKKQVEPEIVVQNSGPLVLGDSVRWVVMNSVGTIVSDPDKKNRVQIQADGAKVWVPLDQLEKISKKKTKRKTVINFVKSDREKIRNEIDLRGQRVDEAIDNIEKFIDEAAIAGFKSIQLIHGKGTGALRKGVMDYLKSSPHVNNYRMGNWNEGDSGVTIVELR